MRTGREQTRLYTETAQQGWVYVLCEHMKLISLYRLRNCIMLPLNQQHTKETTKNDCPTLNYQNKQRFRNFPTNYVLVSVPVWGKFLSPSCNPITHAKHRPPTTIIVCCMDNS